MSETATAQTAQRAAPETGAKAELKVQRKCACGQHTPGGHDCEGCKKKKRAKLQRWALGRPRPRAVLRERGTTGSGFDLSRVRATTPVLPTPHKLRRTLLEAGGPEASPSVQIAAGGPQDLASPTPAALPAAVPQPQGTPPESMSSPDAAPANTPEPGPATSASPAPASLLADDSAMDLAPGQLRQGEFIDQLETAVCAEAQDALAGTEHSTTGCPYLAFWFAYYRRQSAEAVEQSLHRYLPQARGLRTASDYIPLVAARVRHGVEHWVRTGEVTGVPEGAPRLAAARASTGSGAVSETPNTVQLRARDGNGRPSDDPQAVQGALGPGRPLDSAVRGRMEGAFGRSFSDVRLHTDATARRLTSEQNARAFTVGRDVAFASGEYRPGTVVGDALIAHELAHVVQQGATGPALAPMSTTGANSRVLEADADLAAAGALATLWGRVGDSLADVTQRAMPQLRSGLRLSRCDKSGEKSPTVTCPTQTVTMSGAQCGAKYGAVGKYCYSGAKNWWFKEKVVLGSPNTCVPGATINQTTTPFQAKSNCVSDAIFNFNGPPKDVAPCKIVTDQIVFTGPTKADVEKCQYKNEQIIEVTEKAGSTPRAGKVITSSAGVSDDCDWTA